MNTDLDADLRAAFDELAATTSISSEPRFGERAAQPSPAPRRPRLVFAAAACVVLVAGLAVVARDRTHDAVPSGTEPAATDPAPAAARWFLFPDAASPTRYLDPRDAVDAYLADRTTTTAPPGETVTYTVSSDGPPFDGAEDQVAIGFSLTVTPDDAALCCDSGDGIARVELVDGAWFVKSAEIYAMQVYALGYSSDGTVSGAFSPTIGGTYTVTVDDFGAPGGPEEDGVVAADYEPDPADPTNGPTFRLTGYTAPAVAVRFWQSPSAGDAFPAAMFAEFIVPRGTDNASNISIDRSPVTTAPPPDTATMLSAMFPTPLAAAEAYLATATNGTAPLVTAGLLRDVPAATVEPNGRLFTATVDPDVVMSGDSEAWVRFQLAGATGETEGVARVVDVGGAGQPAWTVGYAGTRGVVVQSATYQARLVRAELTTEESGEYLVFAHAVDSVLDSYGGTVSLAIDRSGAIFETGVGADTPPTLALALWSPPGSAQPAFAEVLVSDRGDTGFIDFGALLDASFGPAA